MSAANQQQVYSTVPQATIRSNKEALSEFGHYEFEQLQDARRGRATARSNALRANAALPDDAFEQVDQTVLDTQEDTLTLVADLMAAGLVHEVDLMAEIDTWYRIDQRGEAAVGMSPQSTDTHPETNATLDKDGCPVPMVWDTYSLGFREGPVDGQGVGQSLDTLRATAASRNVSETIERMVIGDENIAVAGEDSLFTLYGLTDHPATATGTTDADWTTDATVIRDDVRRMRGIIKNDRNFNPGNTGFWLYLGTDYYDVLDDADPEGDGNQTVRDRVSNLASISRVRELDYLGNKEALMFRPTEDVVEIGMATDTATVQEENPFTDKFYTIDGKYPRVKQTMDGENGIVHFAAP